MRQTGIVCVCVVIAGLLMACAGTPPPQSADPGPSEPIVEYVEQQEILTPLPLRVRLPASYGAEHVVVLVRTWGSSDWEMIELDRRGQTWTGEVSCRQVSTVTGDTRYYFLALDAHGEVVGGSGSADWPFIATIVRSLPEGAETLDGQSAPLRCHDVADCPPEFPGCPAYTYLRPPCKRHKDCGGTQCAWDGYCGDPHAEIADVSTPEEDDEATDPEEQLVRAVNRAKRRVRQTAKR